MLLKYHDTYSATSLDALNIKGKTREQICVGARANDLCELTSDSQLFIKVPPPQPVQHGLVTKNFLMDGIAIYQSHYGRLASMHAMAADHNVPAVSTRAELQAWFDFLNEISTGVATIKKANQIALGSKKMNEMFANGSIEFEDIIDTDDLDKVRFRSIGMMLHLIQDSYTASHCKRNGEGKLEQFYCYNDQDSDKHKKKDNVLPEHAAAMFRECATCLESVLDKTKYDYSALLILSESAANSDGGDFAK